jgi:hypothetical protein
MRRHFLQAVVGVTVAVGVAVALATAAPPPNPNERIVEPSPNIQDQDSIYIFKKIGDREVKELNRDSKVYVLNFKFKDPRLITVDIPGRGRKICWYLWYQVTNPYDEPKTLIPEFDLVTQDTNKVFRDQILPKAQDAIAKVEDPNDYLKIKNSVTVSRDPIPPTKADAVPRTVTGVAIWDQEEIADSNRYDIYVAGLSNGVNETDPVEPGGPRGVRRKTLQLRFQRVGDKYYQDSREIHFMPPAQWVYRDAGIKATATKDDKPAVKPEKPAPKDGAGALLNPLIPASGQR